ncbi:MAG: histone deacetylase [Peltula sp. TS41687]|nr:MAG: histone deacetylase [Peltula sp. TS41687]
MAKTSVVQTYDPATGPSNPITTTTASSSSTLTLDQKIQREIEKNGIERPKGYTVSWHSNASVERHHFGASHPMKPWRLTLTKRLVLAYGMHTAMDCHLSRAATKEEMAEFHRADYLDFLERVQPDTSNKVEFPQYNIGDDCPIFDGLYDYCALYAGASVDAARKICNDESDIAINWSGGLHHAKKSSASGFCYINDIVLAILQLLRVHPRVLYIDIDVHHGDGVEQAFWSTDRVMTLSFHKYDRDNFFPGTGPISSTGPKRSLDPGAHHSLNVPLNDGIDDQDYVWLFREIVEPAVAVFQPSAIVLQCGADSLGCDRLGCFNLNIPAHGACVEYVKSLRIPLVVLGGGGYTPRNVARLWTYETAVCVGANLNPRLPEHIPHVEKVFAPDDRTLFPRLSGTGRFENKNSREYLWGLILKIREQLRYLQGAPSVQMQMIPPDLMGLRREVDERIKAEREEREEGAGYGERFRRNRERGVGGRGQLVD